MTKVLGALAIAATLAVATVAAPKQAEAGCFGCAVGAGVLAGALIGTAVVNSGPHYGPYAYGPAYATNGCYWQRKSFFDGFVWRVRRVPVCY